MSSEDLSLRSQSRLPEQLMAHDALGAHTRDELGISETLRARPIQAALPTAKAAATPTRPLRVAPTEATPPGESSIPRPVINHIIFSSYLQ